MLRCCDAAKTGFRGQVHLGIWSSHCDFEVVRRLGVLPSELYQGIERHVACQTPLSTKKCGKLLVVWSGGRNIAFTLTTLKHIRYVYRSCIIQPLASTIVQTVPAIHSLQGFRTLKSRASLTQPSSRSSQPNHAHPGMPVDSTIQPSLFVPSARLHTRQSLP